MAEYCSLCTDRFNLHHTDFDFRSIARTLQIEYAQEILCEGCSLATILKEDEGTKEGKIYLGYYIRGETQWRDYQLNLV